MFDVVSVRPTDPVRVDSTSSFALAELQIAGKTLRDILEMAYDVRTFQIPGSPAWVNVDRFDISAKNDVALKEPGKEARVAEMRRGLVGVLADRFAMKVHRETREWPEYALVVAKGGSKLKAPDDGVNNGISRGCGVMTGTRTTTENLALTLSGKLERPVPDKTGLEGIWDFELTYAPDGACLGENAAERPSIFTALQEQLGLKLESAKGPVEVIVIDRAEKPEPN